jgi:thioredoxin 1
VATVEITKDNFEATVQQGGVLLIDCWAPWCGPCRAFGPVYERVADKNPDVTFGKINTEDQPELAARFGINAIPTLMVFREGKLVFKQAGMIPQGPLEDLVVQAKNLDEQKGKLQT